MISTATRDLVIQNLGHILGRRPSPHELDMVVERVALRINQLCRLEQIVREEATRFVVESCSTQ